MFADIVSSLRSLHHSIVVLSLVLITIIVLLLQPDKYSSALNELDIVGKLSSESNWDPHLLEKAYSLKASENGEPQYGVWNIKFLAPQLNTLNEPMSDTHSAILEGPTEFILDWDYVFNSGAPQPYVKPPKTISEIRDIWNKSRSIKSIYIERLLDYAYVQRAPEFPVEKVKIEFYSKNLFLDKNSVYGEPVILRTNIFSANDVDSKDRSLYGITQLDESGYFYGHNWKLWIPAVILSHPAFSATQLLCEKINIPKDNCLVPFEQVFPDIYAYSKDYQDLPFTTIVAMLAEDRKSQYQNIQLADFTLPIDLANGIGSLILIALQFYFFWYLKVFIAKRPKGSDDMPVWIGFYEDNFSRIATFLSIIVLPFATIIYLQTLSLRAHFNIYANIFIVAILVISLFISIIGTRYFQKLWNLESIPANEKEPTPSLEVAEPISKKVSTKEANINQVGKIKKTLKQRTKRNT